MKKNLLEFIEVIFQTMFMPIFIISFVVSYAICWIRIGNYWAKQYFNHYIKKEDI
jgi:hypothetical protein